MINDDEDRSTWPRNGQVIRRDELLRLIEENGGPEGLDLRGATLVGDGPSDDFRENPLDLSAETLAPMAESHQQTYAARAPWLSIYTGGVNLRGARLRRAFLLRARLVKADFGGAELQGAWLSAADLRQADFTMASLDGANVVATQLQGADLYLAESIAGIQWFNAHVDRTRMRREQLGSALQDESNAAQHRTAKTYFPAREAYLSLKGNFLSLGRYSDAGWAYVKERQMEKMAHYWAWRPDGFRLWKCYEDDNPPEWRGQHVWKFVLPWLRNWAYELLTGYGERPLLPLVWAGALAAVVFPLLYWATGALPGHSRALASSSSSDIDWAGWLDSLIFSLTTFGTLSFSRLQPEGTLGNLIASVEAMLAVLLFALFIFTLGNRMSRS